MVLFRGKENKTLGLELVLKSNKRKIVCFFFYNGQGHYEPGMPNKFDMSLEFFRQIQIEIQEDSFITKM